MLLLSSSWGRANLRTGTMLPLPLSIAIHLEVLLYSSPYSVREDMGGGGIAPPRVGGPQSRSGRYGYFCGRAS